MVAKPPTTEARGIRLKTRAIENEAGESIFLFSIAAPPLFNFLHLSLSFDKRRARSYLSLFKGKRTASTMPGNDLGFRKGGLILLWQKKRAQFTYLHVLG
jgi:hypothetical protein